MMLNYSSEIWSDFARALGNHLWQSTLFAVAAGLLTLALRKNHAQARYWVWLAASVKFLVPFSLLVGLGSQLAWTHGVAGAKTGVYVAMEEFSQPFASATPTVTQPTTAQTSYASLIHLLPALLGVVWLCGFLAVLLVWYARWRRVSAAIRKSVELREGREVEALRRLESSGGILKPIPLLLSADSLEPGIFGIARPVLVWPHGISERLEDAHLQAILEHEVCHVRRRDNLAAAIHMLVEAIFWVHPLVWWLGARLVAERERACDEEVLASGTERQVYAESILKICEFCVGSPLACVSGVTGADLKRRIARIMTESFAGKLDFSRKLLLSAAGLTVLALPVLLGLLNVPQTHANSRGQDTTALPFVYEAVSIKPNDTATAMLKSGKGVINQTMLSTHGGITITNTPVQQLILAAYSVQEDRVSGAPDWLTSELYDVEAKLDNATTGKLQKLDSDQRDFVQRRMLQALLADQFKLQVHRDTKELPVYALLIAENGPKLQEATPGNTYADGIRGPDGVPAGAGMMAGGLAVGGHSTLTAQAVPMASLARRLSWQMSRTVLDMTGLRGNYDFMLQWEPEPSNQAFSTAIQQQLGLKLEPRKASMEVLVIDHVEKPMEAQSQHAAAAASGFESSSIKPSDPKNPTVKFMFGTDSFTGTNNTLQMLIRNAYGVEDAQISGGPGWLNSEKYDIDAKMGQSTVQKLQNLSDGERFAEWKRMVQELLEERFKLALHRETKEVPGYALVIANGGPKLHEAKPGDTYSNGLKGPDGQLASAGTMHQGVGELTIQGLPMRLVARLLTEQMGRNVVDKTGLTGNYDFTLKWTPDENQPPMFRDASASKHSGPSLYPAIQEQLGLKLEPQTAPMEVLVVDNAEKPVEN